MNIDSIPHIAIIGAGEIGSRHLQGLALIDRRIDVSVVDPSHSSLKLAKTRFQEISVNEFLRSVKYSEPIEALDQNEKRFLFSFSVSGFAEIIKLGSLSPDKFALNALLAKFLACCIKSSITDDALLSISLLTSPRFS